MRIRVCTECGPSYSASLEPVNAPRSRQSPDGADAGAAGRPEGEAAARAKRWTRAEYDRLIDRARSAPRSLATGRADKGSLYARADLADYWIVNLVDHVLGVHREPAVDARAPYGWRYPSLATLRPDETATPLAAPGAPTPVSDLIP